MAKIIEYSEISQMITALEITSFNASHIDTSIRKAVKIDGDVDFDDVRRLNEVAATLISLSSAMLLVLSLRNQN
jgi:hypothetical protein